MSDSFFEKFALALKQQRLAHALLLVGAGHADLRQQADRMMSALLCKNQGAACTSCQSCQLIAKQEHPDLQYISPETPQGIISVDHIRALQQSIFLATQLGGCRGLIIQPAEKMNKAAANALLKILEEPPENTYFILLAEHTSTIPATILSRCQTWRLTSFEQSASTDEHLDEIISGLCEMLAEKTSAYELAKKWSNLDFAKLMDRMYLVTARMVSFYFQGSLPKTPNEIKLATLTTTMDSQRLFAQFEVINRIIRAVRANIAVNPSLQLETLLMGF